MRWVGLIVAASLVITASGCAGKDYDKVEREAIEAKLSSAGFEVWPKDGFPRRWTRVGPVRVWIQERLSDSYLTVDLEGDSRTLRCNEITNDPPARIDEIRALGFDNAIAQYKLKCALK